MYCSNCGQPNPEGSRFCEQCGSPIEVVSPPISAGSILSTPKWVILSLVAGGLAILGFFLPWINPGGYLWYLSPAPDSLRYSGLEMIGWTFKYLLTNNAWTITSSYYSDFDWISTIGGLILIPLLIFIGLFAIKITLLNISYFRSPHSLPVEAGILAVKIKKFSIFGLICLGIYVLNVIFGFGRISKVYLGWEANYVDFGFWLTVIGFALVLASVTKIRRQKT